MYASKSFCNISTYISNVPNTISPIGEISPDALTYSREIGMYRNPALPGYALFNLKSSDDLGVKSAMNQTLVNEGIALSNHITTYVQGLVGEVFYDEILNNIEAFAQTLNITNLTLGPVVQHNSLWFPDWIKWTSTVFPSANENTIWFSLAALTSQYSDFEIVVVPPVTTLDNFFLSYSSINAMVGAISFAQTIERIQLARGTNPPTAIVPGTYDFINPLNSSQHIPTNWSIIIYGPAGNNVDSIKDALATYILANSTHTRAEWTVIFPDIFKRTEFILAPFWYQYAITPRVIDPVGIYSPVVQTSHINNLLEGSAPTYSPLHIANHSQTFGAPYESIAISAVGGIDNRDSLFDFTQVFPDYINVSTSAIDFNRMDPLTQGFCEILGTMLPIAENMNEFTDMPFGYTKLIRDGILYMVKTYNNMQFLLVSKQSVNDIAGSEGWV